MILINPERTEFIGLGKMQEDKDLAPKKISQDGWT